FFFSSSASLLDPHSFPTRRSSDLRTERSYDPRREFIGADLRHRPLQPVLDDAVREDAHAVRQSLELAAGGTFRERSKCRRRADRSEEHTSELQSRGHLVCRLLLEK